MRHKGNKALEMKNIGKITKFITPAKFSSCLTVAESAMPSAPSMNPQITKAGRTVM